MDKETSEHRYTDGYIAYQGNIYRVDAGKLGQVDMSDTLYWLFEDWKEGEKTLENGFEEATKHIYKAKLVATREMPSVPSAEADIMPRLGENIARRPLVRATYDGSGRIVEFVELSRYSGVLTIAFGNSDILPTNGYFATLELKRHDGFGEPVPIYNTQGKVTHTTSSNGNAIVISLLNGKLTAKEEVVSTNGGYTNQIRFTSDTKVSLFVYWDYEANNGAGASISAGQGSGYRGIGRSEYGRGRDYGYEDSHSRI